MQNATAIDQQANREQLDTQQALVLEQVTALDRLKTRLIVIDHTIDRTSDEVRRGNAARVLHAFGH